MRASISKFLEPTLVVGMLVLILSSCKPQEPVRIGFVAGLTGSNAAIGVDGRDGAMLAVDRLNAEGGINERPIELVIHDDLGTSEGAIAADRELINKKNSLLSWGT